jgi:hypothetical protein
MRRSITTTPPNSLILIMDHSTGVLPDDLGSGLAGSTPSCVAVGTLSEFDGPTTVIVTNNPQASEGGVLIFDGHLIVPSLELSICNVLDERLLSVDISKPEIDIEVYADDTSEPSLLVVRLDCMPTAPECEGP